MDWAKQQEDNLLASKRYLKSDFKVGVTLHLALSLAPDLFLVRPIWHMAYVITHSGFSTLYHLQQFNRNTIK